MAYIADVPLAKAEGPTQLIYREILSAFGFLPHFWEAQGTRPDLMRANVELWGKIYRSGVLSPALKEEILLVVSAANLNSYCIIAHLRLLVQLGVERSLGRKLTEDLESAPVPEKDKAVLRFAVELTRRPSEVRREDIEELRRKGWNEAEILEICFAASHANYFNRLATSLGVIPDDVL